ncbi:MAG: hypothetical protein NTZ04_07710 [Chloroflexi bacterium]|jgi:hypothetical protein|nr:hypothetical protein [Chloroflexota bacterium]
MEKMCDLCQKRVAPWTCHECGIALCDECAREVRIDSTRPGQRMMGRITSPMKSGVQKLKVCEKCFKEKEFLG